MRRITRCEAETEALGYELAGRVGAGKILAFTGGLGAGKTCFVRGLARGLGISDRVTSPTYTIVNEYRGGAIPLIHFDMYRLASADELFEIGWEDYLNQGALIAVEWSGRVEAALPPETIRVRMEQIDDCTREITISGLEEVEPCGS